MAMGGARCMAALMGPMPAAGRATSSGVFRSSWLLRRSKSTGSRGAAGMAAASSVSLEMGDKVFGTNTLVHTAPLSEGMLYVGCDRTATRLRPGNGGLRVRQYPTCAAARDEAVALSEAMSFKHGVYNTGFSGAKLVFDAQVPVDDVDKGVLMREVASVLHKLDSVVYTGCDVNTTDEDMAYLDSLSPYVLAGIGSDVDTNIATAVGAFAAVVRAAEALGLPQGFKVHVQGAGKVGTHVATKLVEHGAEVYVSDSCAERANIPGTTNVSDVEDWASLDVDVLSPNAISGVITEDVAARLRCKAIVGAANVPFKTDAAKQVATDKGITFVPEYITSAGAIIVDSLEWKHEDYKNLTPETAYAFIYDQVRGKVGNYLEAHAEVEPSVLHQSYEDLTLKVSAVTTGEAVVGSTLPDWEAEKLGVRS